MVWILVVTGDSGYSDYTPRMAAGNNFWDFQFNHTEATHMFMWTVSPDNSRNVAL